jgi:basic membrane lipoprotein Med (substrate-binding protein (PBP1-ABC) superfamily)
MEDRDWLSMALMQMHQGQWYGWKKDWTGSERMSYENIIVHDSSITKPTEAEVNAKIAKLKQQVIDTENNKASAKSKLEALGLTTEEIKEAFGI